MKTKRRLFALCFLFTVLACNDKQKEATVSGEKQVPESTYVMPQDTLLNMYPNIDISPMDMSYFPVEYPKLKMANSAIAPPVVRVIYSRPHLGKRRLFHDLLKYDEPWRLGANEATEIDFYRSVTIQNKQVKPGRYVIYCIPHKETWTIVLNSNIDSWGLHQDSTKDIHRFEIPVTSANSYQEYFTIVFEKNEKGADLVMAWDTLTAKLPLTF